MSKLTVTPLGERQIEILRAFAAPPETVFRAFTAPEMVTRWMGVPDWPMTRCEIDLQVGGAIRYEFTGPEGQIMGVSGTFTEIDAPRRLVHSELFDEDWTGGEVTVETVFTAVGPGTETRMILTYSSAEARDAVLGSLMAEGMEIGYARLDALLTA